MSFSYDAKAEVAESEMPAEICCVKAELGGLLRTCGTIEEGEGGYSIHFTTEIKPLIKRLNILMKRLYPQCGDLEVREEEKINHTLRYLVLVPADFAEKLLDDTQMFRVSYDGTKTLYFGVNRYLIENDCCQREFIKGVFMGCASANIVIKDINDLKKHTGGYHLEFVFTNSSLAGDFSHIISQYDIYSKSMMRKKFTVIYIKEAEVVSDTLALVGANNAVLTLQNEFAVREVRNKLNRQLNCMNSNLGKMVEASLKQIEAIQKISDTMGLENLPDNLYELCMLRLANPEETLENLAKLMNPPLTKSGVNHRLRRIVKIATEIEEEERKQAEAEKEEGEFNKDLEEIINQPTN